MLTLNNLKKSYDQISILNGISLPIGTGEIVSILGPSGSGEATLLNCILGIIAVSYIHLPSPRDFFFWSG